MKAEGEIILLTFCIHPSSLILHPYLVPDNCNSMLSPNRRVLAEPVDMVSALGARAFAGHTPLISQLQTGVLSTKMAAPFSYMSLVAL
jgi:hypothetical protein